MNQLYTLVFILLFQVTLSGQISIDKSTDTYKLVTKTFLSSENPIFNTRQMSNGDIVVVSLVGKEFNYFIFDKELNLKYETKSISSESDFVPNNYIETSSSRFLVDSRYDPVIKQWVISCIEDVSGEFRNEKIVLEHDFSDKTKLFSIYLGANLRSYNDRLKELKVSKSKKYIGYVNSFKVSEGKSNQELQLTVFDDDFETVWSKKIRLAERDKDIILLDYEINDAGEIKLLFKDLNKQSGVQYFIHEANATRDNRVDLDLEVDVLNCQMQIINEDNLLVLGYYKESNNVERKFFKIFDKDSKLKKELFLGSEGNLSTLIPKKWFDGVGGETHHEIYSRYIGEYSNGNIQIIDERISYSGQGDEITGLELGEMLIYNLDQNLNLEKVEVLDRSYRNPSFRNYLSLASFSDQEMTLVYVDKLKSDSYVLSNLNSKGLSGDKKLVIRLKDVPMKPSSNNSFIYDDQLYIVSVIGTRTMSIKFQINKIKIIK